MLITEKWWADIPKINFFRGMVNAQMKWNFIEEMIRLSESNIVFRITRDFKLLLSASILKHLIRHSFGLKSVKEGWLDKRSDFQDFLVAFIWWDQLKHHKDLRIIWKFSRRSTYEQILLVQQFRLIETWEGS